MQTNPKDPMKTLVTGGAQELLRRFGQQADGFSADQVMDAAANIIINALRQSHAKRADAEAAFDQLSAKAKAALLDLHYDSLGRKKGIFPYDQTIVVDKLNLRRG